MMFKWFQSWGVSTVNSRNVVFCEYLGAVNVCCGVFVSQGKAGVCCGVVCV